MKSLTDKEADNIEGYAEALQDILFEITGENGCYKRYDPLKVDESGAVIHSYAFDMKDGGRHHPVREYENVDEIKKILLREVAEEIKQSLT